LKKSHSHAFVGTPTISKTSDKDKEKEKEKIKDTAPASGQAAAAPQPLPQKKPMGMLMRVMSATFLRKKSKVESGGSRASPGAPIASTPEDEVATLTPEEIDAEEEQLAQMMADNLQKKRMKRASAMPVLKRSNKDPAPEPSTADKRKSTEVKISSSSHANSAADSEIISSNSLAQKVAQRSADRAQRRKSLQLGMTVKDSE